MSIDHSSHEFVRINEDQQFMYCHPVIKGGHDKIRYQKVLMGKTSLDDGFSSKPCLIARRYDKVGPPQSLHILTL